MQEKKTRKITLLGCPFCNRQPKVHIFTDNTAANIGRHAKYAVYCPKGCVDMGDSGTPQDAARKWNRRRPASKFKVKFEDYLQ